MLTPPTWNDVMSMDLQMAVGVVERLIERNVQMQKTLGPLVSLMGLFRA